MDTKNEIIKEQKEFVINLTTKDLTRATDWCGVKTGAKVDKFKEMNLHKEKANFVNCPMIKESPVSIECRVKEIKELGSHHMFIAEVLAIHADDKYIDEVMKYFKKQIAYDVDGNLKEDDNRTVWIKIHMKYNGNISKNVNMCSGFVVKKDDGKLYPFGVQLFVDREERFTSSKDNSIAYCMDINPGDEYDMWIGLEAPVVNSWTYYLEGSFGYIFQPTGYTGYLIELDIEDRG